MNDGIQHQGGGHESMPEGEEQAPPGTRTMAVVRWALVALVGLTAVGAWAHHFSQRSSAAPTAAQKFVCPMHPQIVTEQKIGCPICGMDLVPVGASQTPSVDALVAPGDVPGLVPVDLSAERVQLMGMKTAVAVVERLGTSLRAVGFVTANENGLVSVSTRFSGWVENLPVAETGQLVRKGEPLMTIYSPELLNAQTVFLNSLKWSGPKGTAPGVPQMATDVERDPRLRLELFGVAAEDIEAIVAAGVPQRTVPVRAPTRGYVARKTVLKGLFVQAGSELFQLADLSKVWVLVDVYESDLGRVQLGQKATFEAASAPGQSFVGRVQFINPVLNTGSRTLQARVELANPRLELRPGMFGDVTLETEALEAVVIPADALVDTGEHRYVFVDRGNGRFEPRAVQTGTKGDGKVAIVEGLTAGEQVVTKANFLIDSESRLRAAVLGHGR
jgi:Cu(I)/Ag(I) efflux system membrane fusion protein